MDLDLQDQRVLVTAGATGIGLATAKAFLREGARVHVCDVDAQALAGLAQATPDRRASRLRRLGPGGRRRLFVDVACARSAASTRW